MNERINGFDPFKDFQRRPETPEEHRQRFEHLANKLELESFDVTSRREDGSTTDLTVYRGVFGVTESMHIPMLRVYALLAGMKEAIPPFIEGPYTEVEGGKQLHGYSYLLLAYYKPQPGA
ncbi:hypothetical protein V2J94_28475 [Streptomyces sp. DSM 41524]|uniref:Uncharacterized protein n=1 Tax=Streptomyces asiaticus subsp. ignotus TaxID=3098222 RepID=A0ABU7Q3E5_9ACTN|nr:hypothetical protein [Streptomyces sp. DSM 41524]